MSNPNLTGWGRGTWNSGTWDSPGSVVVTGVSAATAVGSVQIDITVPVTGVESATAIGSPTITVPVSITVTGVSAAALYTDGYDQFEDPETVDVSLLLGGPGNAVKDGLLVDLCDKRKDCVAFISPPVADLKNKTASSPFTLIPSDSML